MTDPLYTLNDLTKIYKLLFLLTYFVKLGRQSTNEFNFSAPCSGCGLTVEQSKDTMPEWIRCRRKKKCGRWYHCNVKCARRNRFTSNFICRVCKPWRIVGILGLFAELYNEIILPVGKCKKNRSRVWH